jgi:hypothetical protein
MKFLNNLKEYRNEEDYVLGYLNMRKAIGILGISLPVLLATGSFLPWGAHLIMPSISEYYDTWMRDLFVGVLCAVALFLFCYKGLSKVDNRMANLAALFALGVAFFPTSSNIALVHYIHLVSAALFFIILAIISLFIFTIAREPLPDRERKIIRNRIYRICGAIMLGCLLLLFIYMFWEDKFTFLSVYKPVFILETIALFAFGVSWLIKGRTLWANRTEKDIPASAGDKDTLALIRE